MNSDPSDTDEEAATKILQSTKGKKRAEDRPGERA